MPESPFIPKGTPLTTEQLADYTPTGDRFGDREREATVNQDPSPPTSKLNTRLPLSPKPFLGEVSIRRSDVERAIATADAELKVYLNAGQYRRNTNN